MLLSGDEVGRAARIDMREFFFGILIRGRVVFIFVTFSYCLGMVRVWIRGIFVLRNHLGLFLSYTLCLSLALVINFPGLSSFSKRFSPPKIFLWKDYLVFRSRNAPSPPKPRISPTMSPRIQQLMPKNTALANQSPGTKDDFPKNSSSKPCCSQRAWPTTHMVRAEMLRVGRRRSEEVGR